MLTAPLCLAVHARNAAALMLTIVAMDKNEMSGYDIRIRQGVVDALRFAGTRLAGASVMMG